MASPQKLERRERWGQVHSTCDSRMRELSSLCRSEKVSSTFTLKQQIRSSINCAESDRKKVWEV
jgi:hypothetical protein